MKFVEQLSLWVMYRYNWSSLPNKQLIMIEYSAQVFVNMVWIFLDWYGNTCRKIPCESSRTQTLVLKIEWL
jgi:hypothetical protein